MTNAVVLRLSYAPHAGHAPAFVARELGFFAAQGLHVALEPGQGSGHTIQRVVGGEAHFGTVDAFAAMSAWLNGAPVVSLLAEMQESLFGLVVREGAGIERPTELRGRPFGVVPHSVTATIARAMVGRLGIPAGGIALVDLAPGGEMDALCRGVVDAVVAALTNEYVAWTRPPEGMRLRAWSLSDLGIHGYGHALVTSAALQAGRPELVARFVRAMKEGWRVALAHPAEAAAALARAVPGLDHALEEAKFRAVTALAHPPSTVAFGSQSAEAWGRLADLLVQVGGSPRRSDFGAPCASDGPEG